MRRAPTSYTNRLSGADPQVSRAGVPESRRHTILAIVLLAAILAPACAPEYSRYQSPNIILILTDDQGWQDLSVPFWTEPTALNARYHTPNIERLASEGMRFTNAYADPVSTPTRVAILTGLNEARTRVSSSMHFDDSPRSGSLQLLIPPWSNNGLQPNPGLPNSVYARPLPQLLREAGYHTIHIGKGHLGAAGTPGSDPESLGFDIRIGGRFGGDAGSYYGTDSFSAGAQGKETDRRAWDLEKYYGQDIYLTEALTQEAARTIRDAAIDPRPFFLMLAHYAPRAPIMPDPRFVQKYRDAGLDETEAAYASMVEGVDKSVGDILDLLSALELDWNTIVVFMSDNGGVSRAPSVPEPNAPLKGGKGSAYEGGIRVPLIIHWPGVTAGNSVSDFPVIAEDLFPTVLTMAQVSVQGQQGAVYGQDGARTLDGALDGASLVPLLQGHPAPDLRPLHWHIPHAWAGLAEVDDGVGIAPSSAVRRGPWKLIYWHADQRKELYNLDSDIGETTNLAAQRPEIVSDLSADLGTYLRGVHAPMPISHRTGVAVPYPDE